MPQISIREMVCNGKVATFLYYRKGNLYYKTEDGFTFPVPIDDIGDASFHAEEKALHMMRYIRQHLDLQDESQGTT